VRYLVDVEKVETVVVESLTADIVVKAGDELVLCVETVPILKIEGKELFVSTKFSCEVSKFSKPQEELSSIELICPENVQRIQIFTISGNITVSGVKVKELFVGRVFGKTTLHGCDVKNLGIRAVSGVVEMKEVHSGNGVVEVVSGNIFCEEIRGKRWEITTTAGDVKLVFCEIPDMRLRFDTITGKFSSNVPYFLEAGEMVFGLGSDHFSVRTSSGDLKIEIIRSKDKLIEKILRMFLEGKISKETAERLLCGMRGD